MVSVREYCYGLSLSCKEYDDDDDDDDDADDDDDDDDVRKSQTQENQKSL